MTWLRFFQTPWLLPLAVLLPCLSAALAIAWGRRRRARSERLGSAAMVARLAPGIAGSGAGRRAARLGGAVMFGALALAGPRWGSQRTLVETSGVDVVLALDASLSMLATDERPDRLTRVKQEVRRLRAMAPGDRVALIAFAGRSYILTPMTTDEGALDLFIENLDPSVVGQAGSSLARAIRQGTELLQGRRGGGDRAIVLMSDGEAFEPVEDVREAATAAAAAGVVVVTVGFGTPQGATIPVRQGNATTLKRDADGTVVVSHYVPDLLRAAAEAGRGTFIPAEATDKAARVRAALGSLRAQRRAVETGSDLTPRFQLFVAPALLLVLLDAWLVGARRRVGAATEPAAARTAAVAALLFLPLLGGCTRRVVTDEALASYSRGQYGPALDAYRRRAQGGGSPIAQYNFGAALLAADSTDASREPLDRARQAPDTALHWRALFNLGLAHLRRGLLAPADSGEKDLDSALELYRQVLLARPADADAKWNYELALRKKKEQSGGGGGGGGGGGQGAPPPQGPPDEQQKPSGGLGERQAEQLLNAAARDERDVQGRKQKTNQPPPPPGGKDW